MEVVERENLGAGKLVLGFDAGCMSCTDLAQRIEDQVGNKLEVRRLDDPQVQHWREQALGKDAPWAPTLIEVTTNSAKAWTGWGLAVVLTRHLGPVQTWRVLQAMDDRQKSPSESVAGAAGFSRAQVLKGGLAGAVVAVGTLAGSAKFADVAEADQTRQLPASSPDARRVRSIVRSSKQFRELARYQRAAVGKPGNGVGGVFDFDKAEVLIDDDLGLAALAVPAITKSLGIAATFHVDLRDEEVFSYNTLVSVPLSASETEMTAYEDGQRAGENSRLIVAEDYAITEDGRKLSPQQLDEENYKAEAEAAEADFNLQSRCRRRLRRYCRRVLGFCCYAYLLIRFFGRLALRACRYLRNNTGGCASWARRECYLRSRR